MIITLNFYNTKYIILNYFFNRSLQEVLNCKAGDVEELYIYFSVSNRKN